MFLQLLVKTEDEPQWKGAICVNDFTQTIEVSDPFPPQSGQMPGFHRALRDQDDAGSAPYRQDNGFPRVKKATVWDALLLAAERAILSPGTRLSEGPSWNGDRRVARLFLDYFPGQAARR